MRALQWLMWMGAAMASVALFPTGSVFAEDQSSVPPGISAEELDAERGGESIHISEATLGATLDDNTISSSVTGNNSVGGSAFTDANGLFTVIQNSGNQVIIQDSTIVNLTVEP